MSEMYYIEDGKKRDRDLHHEILGADQITPKQIKGYIALAQKLGLSKEQAENIYLRGSYEAKKR